MNKFVVLIMMLPVLAQAQEGKGVLFEEGLSWSQVLAKSKAENKYIFVDCFATWCGPCKKMDMEIYPQDSIGEYMNARFISVKVQMDSTRQDDSMVRSWYADAHLIMQKYKVNSFPTFLFFRPDGEVVHKDIGFRGGKDFMLAAKSALDSQRQYYTLLRQYQVGKKDFTSMKYLAMLERQFKEEELARTISEDYINNYLFKQGEEDSYKPGNIEFVASFIQSSRQKGFNMFYQHARKIDSIMKINGYAHGIVDYVVTKENIDTVLKAADLGKRNPDWNGMAKEIKGKFGNSYAQRNVLDARIRWYEYKKEWPFYTKYLVIRVEKFGSFGLGILDFDLNNIAWDIFLHSNSRTELEKALVWSDRAIKLNDDSNKPNWMDTYANLLYKLKRKDEAIAIEERAVKLNPEKKDFQNNLLKMKNGKPTWVE